jgi:hypothetical protein
MLGPSIKMATLLALGSPILGMYSLSELNFSRLRIFPPGSIQDKHEPGVF